MALQALTALLVALLGLVLFSISPTERYTNLFGTQLIDEWPVLLQSIGTVAIIGSAAVLMKMVETSVVVTTLITAVVVALLVVAFSLGLRRGARRAPRAD